MASGYRTVSRMKKVIPSTVRPATYGSAANAGDDYGVTDPPDWRSIDWVSELKQIEVEGTRVNYVDLGEQGDHRPIVFIHGLSGQWQNWIENLPRFAQTRRVVAMDLPGFGLSPMPHQAISISYYGRVVAGMCDRLGLSPAVIVGNSMGGFIAAEVASRRPDVVERQMLVSAAGVSQMNLARSPALAFGKGAALLASSNVAQLQFVARRPRLRHWILSIVARHPSRLKADTLLEGLMKGTGKPGFEQALLACIDYDFRERLPKTGCPTLVLWGEDDAIIPVADADRFVKLIPGSRKIVLEDTGHVPMVERPPTFNRILQEFLDYDVDEGELESDPEEKPDAEEKPDPVSR
jgi:pimeloyl-ACP methyl ester carboxylesterase